jgi:hypothetical protein
MVFMKIDFDSFIGKYKRLYSISFSFSFDGNKDFMTKLKNMMNDLGISLGI